MNGAKLFTYLLILILFFNIVEAGFEEDIKRCRDSRCIGVLLSQYKDVPGCSRNLEIGSQEYSLCLNEITRIENEKLREENKKEAEQALLSCKGNPYCIQSMAIKYGEVSLCSQKYLPSSLSEQCGSVFNKYFNLEEEQRKLPITSGVVSFIILTLVLVVIIVSLKHLDGKWQLLFKVDFEKREIAALKNYIKKRLNQGRNLKQIKLELNEKGIKDGDIKRVYLEMFKK